MDCFGSLGADPVHGPWSVSQVFTENKNGRNVVTSRTRVDEQIVLPLFLLSRRQRKGVSDFW